MFNGSIAMGQNQQRQCDDASMKMNVARIAFLDVDRERSRASASALFCWKTLKTRDDSEIFISRKAVGTREKSTSVTVLYFLSPLFWTCIPSLLYYYFAQLYNVVRFFFCQSGKKLLANMMPSSNSSFTP